MDEEERASKLLSSFTKPEDVINVSCTRSGLIEDIHVDSNEDLDHYYIFDAGSDKILWTYCTLYCWFHR